MNDNYPDLNGVTFEKNETGPVSYMGYKIYNDLNMKMDYHGRILVGSGLIHDYYIHIGYQRAFAYKVLKEFIFEEGVLLDIIDHSDMAEKLRAEEDKKGE